jgi:hypothetical protein
MMVTSDHWRSRAKHRVVDKYIAMKKGKGNGKGKGKGKSKGKTQVAYPPAYGDPCDCDLCRNYFLHESEDESDDGKGKGKGKGKADADLLDKGKGKGKADANLLDEGKGKGKANIVPPNTMVIRRPRVIQNSF